MLLRIDNEFKNLIPPLSAEEYGLLEKSVIEEGCRDSLVVWNGVLVDGHNRYEICRKHGIKFEVTEKEFESRDHAKEWIIKNQFGRRNLSAYDRAILALKLKGLFQDKAREKQRESGGAVPQKSAKPPIDTRKELANVAGVSHDTIHKVEKIEEKASEEVKKKLKQGELTINKAYNYIKRQEIKEQNKEIPPPKGKYRIIYADPPWCYGDKRDGKTTGAEDHYPSMTIQELCELSIKELAEENAVLFLWVTSPLLEECFEVIKAWGFKYKTSFVWDKVKHNMGHYNSVRHEFLLICTRGSCLPDNPKLFDSVVTVERSNKHSEKPEEFRKMIDELYQYGNKIELFSRKKVEGWDAWGNQT